MTIVAFPLDAVSGAPSYTGEMLRQSLSTLAGYAPSGRPLGATTGVRGGTPTTTVTATSTTWTIAPHSGCLDLETSATAGPYLYAVSAAETGTVTAANSTNDRIDIVYVKVNDPAEGDGSSTPGVVSGYLAGTAAPTPAAPATPARSMVLAQIYVPKSGTGSPSVTWVAPTTTASGTATAYSYGSTTTGQSFVSAGPGTVNTWSLSATNNITYSNGTWTVTVPGFYYIRASLSFVPNASPAGVRQIDILLNGTSVDNTTVRGDVGYAIPMKAEWAQVLAVGDAIRIQGYQNQGTSLALSPYASHNNVSIRRIGDA